MRPASLNLATQPFSRVRRARRVVGRVALVLVLVTALHAGWLAWLTREPAIEHVVVAPVDPATLQRWQREVEQIAQAADVQRARAAVTAVALGNQLVAWRTIPWEAIFSDLEQVLPERVKLESVQPGIETGDTVRISIVAAARDHGPLHDFFIEIEAHPRFTEVYPQQETTGLDGLERLTLQARYLPPGPGNPPAAAAEVDR